MILLIHELLTNKIIITVVIATVLCQLLKFIDSSIVEKKIRFGKLFATGGMPSSHSTFVTSLALSVGFKEGFLTAVFLVAMGFAIITIRDAFGVRRTVDDLIKSVNEIIKSKKLKVSVIRKIAGHTPVQVIMGTILGIVIAIFIELVI